MLRRLTRIFVHYAERYIPDPYIYALILTFVTAAAAFIWTGSDAIKIVTSWYDGIWAILAFAMQMALILSTGVALADAPPVRRLLERVAAIPVRQSGAVVTLFLVGAFANFLNWGFGLVVGALLAREMAKRIRDVDFGLLVAVAYMGNMVWASGLSSSIALASATPGSALNIIEKVTGRVAGLNETIFTAYNLVPTILVFCLIPLMLVAIAPGETEMKRIDPELLKRQDASPEPESRPKNFASVLEDTPLFTLLLVAMGIAYEANIIATRGFTLDINGMIFIALMLGLIFHWRPIRYVRAFNKAARTVGPILLQFPLYGGIMGMMTGTGLAAVIAEAFVAFSTQRTLPFWSFISSNIISLFVPSGGGHWAVQGPFMVPAAVNLGVDPALTAMATAMGEQTANMIQPFWALPVLAIAGLGIKDIMGYCVMALLVGLVIYGGALLVFA
ncbi:MAG: short-chain fatty acid transporter [Alphaproteobacteria bacterium]|jgi:short-chain fatty acids transporter|nr:short-chain fatty acid transporter [Alphaproteobacteria bacterium]